MSLKALSDYVFYSRYSRFIPEKNRRETWQESVKRVFDMHRTYYADVIKQHPELLEEIEFAERQQIKKRVLASQRSLQFAGDPILKHHAKMFNCSATHIDRAEVFQEILYMLLCGCGVGFSVQKHHVSKLPNIAPINPNNKKTFVIEDSIEGWSDAVGALMSSYFTQPVKRFEEWSNAQLIFDSSKIRPEGSLIAGQFKAPGDKGLIRTLQKIVEVIQRRINSPEFLTDAYKNKLRPIDCYDIIMHISDSVLSGGVRRCLPGYYSVQVADGSWKKIVDLTTDDQILFMGKCYPVDNVFSNGVQPLVKIQTSDGFHVSTPNHRWLVYNTSTKQVEWVEAQNIIPSIHKFMKEKNK